MDSALEILRKCANVAYFVIVIGKRPIGQAWD